MTIANDKLDGLRREAERLEGRADHFLYGDGNDAEVGTGMAVMALVNAVLAGQAVSDEAREFEIRKTALLAAASKIGRETENDGWMAHNQSVIDTARDFEPYLRHGASAGMGENGELTEEEHHAEFHIPEDHEEPNECDGHPASEFGEMGVTEYCDGSCKR